MKKLFIGLLTLTTLDAFACNSPVGGFCKGESVIISSADYGTIPTRIIAFSQNKQIAITKDVKDVLISVSVDSLYKITGYNSRGTSRVGDEVLLYHGSRHSNSGKLVEAKIEGFNKDDKMVLSITMGEFKNSLVLSSEEDILINSECSDNGEFCKEESVIYATRKNKGSRAEVIAFSKNNKNQKAITKDSDGDLIDVHVDFLYKTTGCIPSGAYCVGDEAFVCDIAAHGNSKVTIEGVRKDGKMVLLFTNNRRQPDGLQASWSEKDLYRACAIR